LVARISVRGITWQPLLILHVAINADITQRLLMSSCTGLFLTVNPAIILDLGFALSFLNFG
jgi:hypothetical protein